VARVYAELCHRQSSLRLDLPGYLLDLEDVDYSAVDVVLGSGLLVALDEVSLPRRRALESALGTWSSPRFSTTAFLQLATLLSPSLGP
jgi:hypothetical protein